jgi:hypothetical protein
MRLGNYCAVASGAVVLWLGIWGSRNGEPSLTLLYTTEVQGYVEPCG